MFGTILLAGFLASALAALPIWPYSRRWGFTPSIGLGAVLATLFILAVFDPNF